MRVEREADILAPFKARAEKGELIQISEIAKAYQSAVDHPVSRGQIYCVLHPHGWRKVMPRSGKTVRLMFRMRLDLGGSTSQNTAGVKKGFVPVCLATISGSIAMPMER